MPPETVTGTAPPLPTTLDAVTPAWLTAALGSPGHADERTVTAVTATAIGTGQMCDSFRLKLTWDRDGVGPATLVAKLPAAADASREAARAMRCYEKEVRFYQQLAPGLPVRTPSVFYADLGADPTAFVLLLEDVAPAWTGDQIAGCSPSMAVAAIDQLARLHAPRWGDETLGSYEWLHSDAEANSAFMLALLPGLWAGFRDRYAAQLTPDVDRAGRELFDRLDVFLARDPGPWTIVHGDYRLDNLLFADGPDGMTATVVDWQTCRHGPGLDDVAYFIGAGLVPAERRQAETGLVRRYHDALVAAGVGGYGWQRCWHDYRRGSWGGLVMAIAASMLVNRTERGDRMFLTMAARHARHALDLDAAEVLDAAEPAGD